MRRAWLKKSRSVSAKNCSCARAREAAGWMFRWHWKTNVMATSDREDLAARCAKNGAKAVFYFWFLRSPFCSRRFVCLIISTFDFMAKASDLDVAYVSKLARLNLTDEETQLFQKQLADVLKYAEKLREVDVSQVEAAAHAIPIYNVFREDEPRDWFTAQEALSNAPHKANQLFIVTKVVE